MSSTLRFKVLLLNLASLALFFTANAQTDSLILKNKNIIVGEIKSMDKGVLTIETDYSDSDFKVSWSGIDKIFSKTKFLITTEDGRRFNGTINSTEDEVVSIDTYDPEAIFRLKKKPLDKKTEVNQGIVSIPIDQVVYLNALDEGFWSRLSASIDLGWSVTKANNLRQLSIRSGVGYLADRWKLSASINTLSSNQDEVDPTKRTDADLTYNYFLPKDWYLLYNITFLSNTEQLIKLRTGNKVGLGKYLVHTNKTYFGFTAGVNFNNEVYIEEEGTPPTDPRRTGEAFIGSELNLYDIGDLTLFTNVVAYPSFSESGRFRTDFKLDVKYEFLSDFYVKLGTTVNYDNRPVAGATTVDYVFQTTVGWSL
ncbi:DUF481 domain-containing protein [Algoriphagus namhaensis]|uniref:DUF481 domain-containing protein n=1 Tax=Algoriphagus namhaensis TaxID=915353 RepID=A0ABV8ALU8_9BACT